MRVVSAFAVIWQAKGETKAKVFISERLAKEFLRTIRVTGARPFLHRYEVTKPEGWIESCLEWLRSLFRRKGA